MTSTFTSSKGLEEPAAGDLVNAWAPVVNSNWSVIDTALGGTTSISVTGISAPTTTLTLTQYRPPNIEFTGTLATNLNYQIPTGVGGMWSISNSTSGAFTLSFSIAAGNSLTLAPGRTLIISDGTIVALANPVSLNPSSIGPIINPITQAEINASIVPTNQIYLEGDLRRYGGDPTGVADASVAWQSAISVGIARILKGCSYKIVTPATTMGQVTILGEGKTSKLLCDGTVLTVTSGIGSFVDNFWMENITAPWIITRNPNNWTANIAGTLQQSNTVLGYQPTSNDVDIWSSLTSAQQNQQIGPTIQFVGAASLITVSRIYGRFVRVDIHDATDSQIIDCDVRGGKGIWGALTFNNLDAGVQRGANNRAINNRVSYSSFTGVFFSSNDDFTLRGNVCYLCGESGTKTTQTLGLIFTASVGGATSGTLSPAVTSGVYNAIVADGEGRTVTVTGGTAATWSGTLNTGTILCASAWQSALNPQCFRGQIVDNHCYQNYYDGLDCDSTFPNTCDAAGTFHQIHNNYSYLNGGDGINTDGLFNSCVGNRLIQNYKYGIWGICSFSVVADNACVDNNQQRNSGNHDITVGGPFQMQNYLSGNYVWAGGTQNNFGIYAPGLNKIGDNYGVGSTFFFGNAGQISSVVQNYNDASTGLLTDQSFVLQIQNGAGTIQHRIFDDAGAGSLGNYTSRINSATPVLTNTPTGADSTTPFAAGGKISSAATSQFVFDTAAQFSANDQMIAVIESNSTGTDLNVNCSISNLNVNGVTRTRLVFGFNNATTDAVFNLTTLAVTNYIKVRFYGKIA